LAFVTFGHHALIAGNRKGAIIGTFLTIIFAIIFTALQYFEYSEAAFTMSDGVYGSAFYASTGLHGLTVVAPTKFNINSVNVKKIHYRTLSFTFVMRNSINQNNFDDLNLKNKLICCQSTEKEDKLLIRLKNKNKFLNKNYLEWLTGFVDAEGNFNISLRNFKENKYNSLILTFQIGLHIDELELLKLIQKKLHCGHISISGNRCNFFVNDQYSLIHIILPIFNFVKLNSSKYFQFLIFEKAVNFVNNKNHLSSAGKLEIIKLYYEIKNPLPFTRKNINLSLH
jgi:hypothetical protein